MLVVCMCAVTIDTQTVERCNAFGGVASEPPPDSPSDSSRIPNRRPTATAFANKSSPASLRPNGGLFLPLPRAASSDNTGSRLSLSFQQMCSPHVRVLLSPMCVSSHGADADPRLRCSNASTPPACRCQKRPENLLSGEGALGSGLTAFRTLLMIGRKSGLRSTGAVRQRGHWRFLA